MKQKHSQSCSVDIYSICVKIVTAEYLVSNSRRPVINMAAAPRKFIEKIALHTQKQAEETAAFEQILRVSKSRSKTTSRFTFSTYAEYRNWYYIHAYPLPDTHKRELTS